MKSSILMHAEDLVSMIESIKINSPILIGHSLGAYIVGMKQVANSSNCLLDGIGGPLKKKKLN